MAFKTALLICGLVLSVQHACGQVVGPYGRNYGFGNAYHTLGVADVDITAVDIDVTGIGAAYGHGYGIGNAGFGLGAAGFGLGGVGLGSAVVSPAFINLNTIGGVLPISSIGPVVPAGLTVVSDNLIEGIVTVDGQLPFLSAVAFDGVLPSAGSGHTQCGCGTAGNIGIISETVGSAPVGFPANAGVHSFGLGGLVGTAGLFY